MEKNYLLQIKFFDGEISNKIVNENEIINFINMLDLIDDIDDYFIYEIDFENLKPIYYVGWQPDCLIELKNKEGEIVIRGFGTDH